MKLTRTILIASVALVIYAGVMLCVVEPWFIVIFAVAVIAVAGKRSFTRLTAFGTARWASAEELSRAGIAANLVLIGAGIGKGSKGDDDDDDDDEEEDGDGDDNSVSMAT